MAFALLPGAAAHCFIDHHLPPVVTGERGARVTVFGVTHHLQRMLITPALLTALCPCSFSLSPFSIWQSTNFAAGHTFVGERGEQNGAFGTVAAFKLLFVRRHGGEFIFSVDKLMVVP